jgi:hypothetical protein
MAAKPVGDWAGRELADLLAIKPRNMLTQLAEWRGSAVSPRPAPAGTSRPSQQTLPDRNPLAATTSLTPGDPA